MAKKKQPRSLEMAAGMPNQHLNKLGVALMDDNIVNVFSEIFNKFKPRGCIVCDRSKNSREYAKTKIPIKKEIKMLYRFRLHRNDLTGPRTQRTQRERREMNNSDVTGFDIKNPLISIRKKRLSKTTSRQID